MGYTTNQVGRMAQVVLVAQSMGGFSMTHAMEQFSHKIVLAIAVAAILLLNGASIDDSPTFSDMVGNSSSVSRFHGLFEINILMPNLVAWLIDDAN
jgi:predicted alpha/beta hydrolase family esterase